MSATSWRVTAGGVTGCPVGTLVELAEDDHAWRIAKPGVGVMQTLPKATTIERHDGDALVLTNAEESVEISLSPMPNAPAPEGEPTTPDGTPRPREEAPGCGAAAIGVVGLAFLTLVITWSWFSGAIALLASSCVADGLQMKDSFLGTFGVPLLAAAAAVGLGTFVFRVLGWGTPKALGLAALAVVAGATGAWFLAGLACGIG